MTFTKIIRILENPLMADKSAMGAINRPLRIAELLFHLQNRVPTLPGGRDKSGHYTIRLRNTPMPSISNSMTSPRWNQG
jgi:hypothetical protein